MENEKAKPNTLKLFLENFLVYGVGGVIGKIIPLVILPIVTRLLPDTSYFGISDMSGTIASFGSACAVLGMYDAMYRLFFEKDELEYKRVVCSTTLTFTLVLSLAVTLLMIAGRTLIAGFAFKDIRYAYVVYISALATLVSATNSIVSAPTRMQNQRKIYIAANTAGPIISYAIAIALILKGHYTIALPLAMLIGSAGIEASFLLMNRKWFSFRLFDKKILKQMLVIAIPLLPNFLIYWIFNSCDKFMITNYLSIGAEGIYSVGAKLGHASQLIYIAFAGGWQFFAFSTMKEDRQVESNSRIFEYLGIISFACSAFIFALARLIYQLLFTGDYVGGYIVSPYLFMAPLMQMLYQVISNQFLSIKKTWPTMFILMGGAAFNVLLNYFLIPIMGIEGAAIATLIGYVSSVILCCLVLRRMKLIVLSAKFLISCGVMTAYILLWRFLFHNNTLVSFLLAVAASAMMCFFYRAELSYFCRKARTMVGKKQ